jgi:hypothetical protein
MTPRLIPLPEAKAYLGGRHPVSLGIAPVVRGLWDIKALDAWLDQKSGLVAQSAPQGAANDTETEHEALARRIFDAPRRA